MLTNDLDGIIIVKWEVPECSIIYKKDSKILKEEFKSKAEAVKFICENKIKIQEWIGKGWNENKGWNGVE